MIEEPLLPDGESPSSSDRSRARLTILRSVAIVGTSVVFLSRAASLFQMEPRQEWGIVILVVASLAVGITCLTMLRVELAKLSRHWDLLLPLGLYITAQGLLELLMVIPVLSTMLTPFTSFQVLSLSFSISVAFILQLALSVVYAGWVTALIIQAVRENQVDPLSCFVGKPNWFWRVLGAMAIGWTVEFAVLAVVLAVGMVVLPLALLAIAVFSVVWNLMTAAFLPVVVSEDKPFGDVLREGFRVSWENKSRWWLVVVAQMVLLGWVTFFAVSYTSNPRPGTFTTQEKTDFSVNAFWTGGYEDECRWHSKLMAAAEAKQLPLAQFLLSLVFAVLAVLVKLRITDRLYSRSQFATVDSSTMDYEPPPPEPIG
jgi:hypothetical protein